MTQGILITAHFTLRDVTVDIRQLRPAEAIPVALGEVDYLGYPVEDDGTPTRWPPWCLTRKPPVTRRSLPIPPRLCGEMWYVRADGADFTEEDRAAAEETVRAARMYCEDYPEEYALWRSAAGWR